MAIDDDKFIPGLSKVAGTITRHGARAVLQLHHAGRAAPISSTKVQPVAPSAIPGPMGRYKEPSPIPRELTIDEIDKIIARFANGARRAKKAGFDGVEIHADRNYLITNFLSRASNKREDAYGGELRNRPRLLLEILGAIRESVGEGYPVWPRLNALEFGIPDGITLEETLEVARMAQDAGANAIHVIAYSSFVRFPPMAEPPGNLVYLAEAVKKVVGVPVVAGGRIAPEVAEKILQEGKADLVAMGRALIADPELPNKVALGKKAKASL